jgi:hypothetical protein
MPASPASSQPQSRRTDSNRPLSSKAGLNAPLSARSTASSDASLSARGIFPENFENDEAGVTNSIQYYDNDVQYGNESGVSSSADTTYLTDNPPETKLEGAHSLPCADETLPHTLPNTTSPLSENFAVEGADEPLTPSVPVSQQVTNRDIIPKSMSSKKLPSSTAASSRKKGAVKSFTEQARGGILGVTIRTHSVLHYLFG